MCADVNLLGSGYSPLAKDTIRLLRFLPHSTPEDLHCTLELQSDYYSRPEGNDYTALSYCWGDATEVTYIRVNGTRFKVTANLWEALSTIFMHHHEANVRYWIDAICINQADVVERNEQVYQMWRIYSAADRVFAWLGPEDADTVKAFETMEHIFGLSKYKYVSADARTQTRAESPPLWRDEEEPDPLPRWCSIASLRDLLRRPYFSRTWIIQEFTQAKRLFVVCGRCRWYWSTCHTLSAIGENSQAGRLLERRRPRNLGRDIRWNRLPENTNEHVFLMLDEAGGVFGLLDRILEGYLESSCSEPRDKIFALIGDPVMRALDPAMQLVPDYGLLLEELALVFIAYCDGIYARWSQILPALAGSHTPRKDLPEVLLSLHRASGTERDRRKFLEALDRSATRIENTSEGSCTLILLCGARIDCSGPLMRTLLSLPASKTTHEAQAIDRNDRCLATITSGGENARRLSCLCPDCPYC